MNEFVFPKGFLMGSATAAHQVEGNNLNCDSWLLEHLPGTIFAEPSGDAIDHYHRYPQDIALLAQLGFNAYRFSIEWARIEPEEGEFSYAELEHYRRMLAACHENGITPMLTFHHFTSPRWLLRQGGWLDEKTPERFARYCERATHHLGDLIGAACTMNEANIAAVLAKLLPFDMQKEAWWGTAAQAFGVAPERLGLYQFVANARMHEIIMQAHRRAFDVLHAGPGSFPVGLTLALLDIQAGAGGEDKAAGFRRDMNEVYLEQLRGDDFVGVQTYSRMRVGPDGLIPPVGVELNQMGEEYYPEALAGTIRAAAEVTGLPIYVTENGLSGTDDTRRVEYIQRALRCVAGGLQAGIDIRGYFCWSAFDNYEWISGYRPQFGLIAVDRKTQQRSPKPSAYWLGAVAKKNRIEI